MLVPENFRFHSPSLTPERILLAFVLVMPACCEDVVVVVMVDRR